MIKKIALLLLLIGFAPQLLAANYTLPADLTSSPFNCTNYGGCFNSIFIPSQSQITLTSDINLAISGNLTIGNGFIGIVTNGYNLNITVYGNVNIYENSNFNASLTATGSVNINENSTFTGDITSYGNIQIGSSSTFNGSITTTGSITINEQAAFTGDIFTYGDIVLGQNGIFTGDITTTGSLNIGSATVVYGVCTPSHPQCTGGVVPVPGGCDNLADNFDAVSYSNQDGTINWTSNWSETNDDGSPSSGEIRITGSRLDIENSDRVITRNGDLSSYSTATLTFDYLESRFDNNNDYIDIEVRGGGNGWTSLQNFAGSNVGSGSANLTIPGSYLGSNFQIRFITSPYLGGSDRFYIDNLNIEACGNATVPAPAIDFHFDESSWNGVTNEVVDSSVNASHASISSGSGVDTISAGQVCRAGRFDGLNDYLISNDIFSLLRTTASMSFWIKTTQTGDNTNWLAPGVSGIEQSGGGNDIFWGWLDASGRIGISKWDTPSAKSTSAINDGAYHHIVLTRESSTGAYKIYIDGALNTSGTTETGDVGTFFNSIGRIEDTAGSPEYLRADLDELMVFNSILSDTQVADIYTNQRAGNNYDGSPRVCPASGVDHYVISHSNIGVTCEAQAITVTAHNASHAAIAPSSSTTITLSTSIPNDGWALRSGGGTFTAPDQYTFDGSETSVQFWLSKTDITAAPHMDVDVTDGLASDNDGGSENPGVIEFRDTAFRFYADTVNDAIGTQIAGKSSDSSPGNQALSIKAVQTNTDTGACDTLLNGVTPVQIAFECINPNICARPLYLGNTSASTSIAGTNSGSSLNYQNVTLDFGATGEANFVINYPDAGALQLHAQHTVTSSLPGTGITLNGNSNQFVSRPFGFNISAVGNPAATDYTGTIYTAAGMPFSVNVSAVLWSAADDTDNDGRPDNHDDNNPGNNADLSNNIVNLGGTSFSGTPNFGQEGERVDLEGILISPYISAYPDADFPVQSLSGFSSGSATTASAAFNDVGIIEIGAVINSGDYLGIGSIETARMISKSGYVGRFIPASFSVAVTSDGVLDNFCSSGTPFTYIGQDFGYLAVPALRVTALNALTTPSVTQNYRGNYAKLSDSSITVNVTQDGTTTGSDGNPLLVNYSPQAMTATANNDGTVDYLFGNDQFRYGDSVTTNSYIKLANSEVAPFTADIDPLITLVDDGEVSSIMSQALNPIGNNQRFGRIRMSNAYGSELIDLQMPMIIEYFNGTSYQNNADDSCTVFSDPDLIIVADGLITPGASTITVSNPTAIAGDLGITLSSPGVDNVGTIDLNGLLTGGVNENKWLRYDWDVDGVFDNDPTAQATFGIYKGDGRQIYLRQIYQ